VDDLDGRVRVPALLAQQGGSRLRKHQTPEQRSQGRILNEVDIRRFPRLRKMSYIVMKSPPDDDNTVNDRHCVDG
jgi:hypothetical protein